MNLERPRYFAKIKVYDSKDRNIIIIPISSDFDLTGYKLKILGAKAGLMRLEKPKNKKVKRMTLISNKDKKYLEEEIQKIIDQKFGKKYVFKLADLDLNKEFEEVVKKPKKKKVK